MKKKLVFLFFISFLLLLTLAACNNNSYTLRFSTDVGGELPDVTVKKGESVLLPVPEAKNYQFLGWYFSDSQPSAKATSPYYPVNNVTLFAQWKRVTEEDCFTFTRETDGYTVSAKSLLPKHTAIPDIYQGRPVTAIGELGLDGTQSELENLEIPEGVTEIRDSALKGCAALKTVGIPITVVTVGERAFSDCTSLRKLVFPNNVERIGAYALSNCNALTDVRLPKYLNKISDGLFYGCGALTNVNVPYGTVLLGNYAFYKCSSLTELILNEELSVIGASCFEQCSSLKKIEIPENVFYIDNSAFYRCVGLTEVKLPTSLKYIGNSAFNHCSSLSEIEIPSKITTIGDYAFAYSSLSEFTIPSNVKNLGICIVAGCKELVSLQIENDSRYYSKNQCIIEKGTGRLVMGCGSSVIPNDVKIIGKNAFRQSNLKRINIPDSVTEVESEAFAFCYRLYSVKIGKGVSHLAANAFTSCFGLAEVYNFSPLVLTNKIIGAPDGIFVAAYDIYTDPNATSKVTEDTSGFVTYPTANDCILVTYVGKSKLAFIPEGVTVISSFAFYESEIERVYISNSVTLIDSYAFFQCDKLTSVTLGNGLKTIRSCAFEFAVSLKEVTIPKNVTAIGDYAFNQCDALESISFLDTDGWYFEKRSSEQKTNLDVTDAKRNVETLRSNPNIILRKSET